MAHPRVLLTGANGFIGSHIISHFLEKSVFVQAVVRSESKAKRVMEDFPSADRSKLGFSIVPDITAPGAFDKAVQEAQPLDAVIHTASPFLYDESLSVEDLIKPAINGTSEILKSTLKYAPGVKRVVVTSSFAAIGNFFDSQGNGRVYTSDDWNPITMEQATSGNNLRHAYWGSKTYAEKAGQFMIPHRTGRFTDSVNSLGLREDQSTTFRTGRPQPARCFRSPQTQHRLPQRLEHIQRDLVQHFHEIKQGRPRASGDAAHHRGCQGEYQNPP